MFMKHVDQTDWNGVCLTGIFELGGNTGGPRFEVQSYPEEPVDGINGEDNSR